MKLLAAFLKLIRSLNLLFIAVTQLLFQYCIVLPALKQSGLPVQVGDGLFFLLMLASICIAAGGYIINDYFDLNIDRVNKPDKLVVEKLIKRRFAILWHLGLSITGIVLSFYVGYKVQNILLGFANSLCVLLLWFYSTSFKKKLLIGNVIISLLTAWVVLVLYFVHIPVYSYDQLGAEQLNALSRIFKLAVLYGGFAFIISLIREVVKDMEDMPGDARYGCRTMPIVWGMQVSRVFIATWVVVLIASILIILVYVLPYKWWWPSIYCTLLILIPLGLLLQRLFKARSPADFHRLSSMIKAIMLTGILSILFFNLYA